MGTFRRVVLRVAACAVAAATGVSRAQEARGADASSRGEKSAVATNAVQGVGTDANLWRQPLPRDRPASASGQAQGIQRTDRPPDTEGTARSDAGAGAASRGVAGAARQDSQGVAGAAKSDSQGVSGSAKTESQGVSGAARQESSVGSLVSQEREPGRGQQRNLEVIMDLLGGSQAPEPPPADGGGSMKAASELGGGNAPYPAESRTPPDSRAVLKMDPNQQRKSGS